MGEENEGNEEKHQKGSREIEEEHEKLGEGEREELRLRTYYRRILLLLH